MAVTTTAIIICCLVLFPPLDPYTSIWRAYEFLIGENCSSRTVELPATRSLPMRLAVSDRGEAVLAETPRARLHWRRNKRPAVDLAEHPFAVERQLEDQRALMRRNRWEGIVPGEERRLRTLPEVEDSGTRWVGEIIRAETGVTDYVASPRPRPLPRRPVLDADTLPLLRPYRREAQAKPTARSFGHRPSSASRTFHPASMKVRLRHGEVVQAPLVETGGLGLPTASLAALLAQDTHTTARSEGGVGEEPAVAGFFDEKFDYATTLRHGEAEPPAWDSSHHIIAGRRREPRSTRQAVPVVERLRLSNPSNTVISLIAVFIVSYLP